MAFINSVGGARVIVGRSQRPGVTSQVTVTLINRDQQIDLSFDLDMARALFEELFNVTQSCEERDASSTSPLKRRLGIASRLSEAQRWHLQRNGHTEDEVDCMDWEEVSAILQVYAVKYREEKQNKA